MVTSDLTAAFADLEVSVALSVPGGHWHALHSIRGVQGFEYEYGVEARRWQHNEHHFAEASRTRRPSRGEHAGFQDLFVPVCDATGVRGFLAAGPFALTRPSSAEVLERWFRITGKQGHLGDPTFAHYLSVTLSTLTLEGPQNRRFREVGFGIRRSDRRPTSGESIAPEADAARARLSDVRFPEQMWRTARSMVNQRDAHHWTGPSSRETYQRLSLTHAPQHVVVGFTVADGDERDPVGGVLDVTHFSASASPLHGAPGKWCVAKLAITGSSCSWMTQGHERGYAPSSASWQGRWPAWRGASNLRLRCGVSHGTESISLPTCYRAALWAAEKALSDDLGVVHGNPKPVRSAKQLRELRNQLAENVPRTSSLSARFDQYVEAVLVHCGYRLEPTRAHLESGLERLGAPLLAIGALDEKSFDEMVTTMELAADVAETTTAIVIAYRRLVADIEAAIRAPRESRQERNLERALRHVREHLDEHSRFEGRGAAQRDLLPTTSPSCSSAAKAKPSRDTFSVSASNVPNRCSTTVRWESTASRSFAASGRATTSTGYSGARSA